MLEIKKLSAHYSGIRALVDVSLSIKEGDFVTLIGANGAGKSTLLNCISGVVKPSGGTISFDGADITGGDPWTIARSGLVQVPEGRLVLADMSVLENLQLGQLSSSRRAARYGLDDVFDLFPILAERRSQMGGSLSGGQQQMLAIGRALMGSPRLLLLDEPSLGLAPIIVKQVFATLQQINASGLTIVLVEQNARQALRTARLGHVIERGVIVRSGECDQMIEDPAVVDLYLGKSDRLSGKASVPA